MRSSAILASGFAALVIATPLRHAHNHQKKAIVWDVVTDIVVVTVTENVSAAPTSTQPPHVVHISKTKWINWEPSSAAPSSTSTSTSEAPVVVVTTTEPAPVPTTTSEPITTVEPVTTQEPVVIVTTTQEPVAVPSTTEVAPVAAATTTAAAAIEVVTQAAIEAVAAASTSTSAVAVAVASSAATSFPTGSLCSAVEADVGVVTSQHGTARAAHSAPSLAWNNTLAESAAVLAATCVFEHNMDINGGGYGQNLALQGSSDANAWTTATALKESIINAWYSEESIYAAQYGYTANSPTSTSQGDWMHFTQMIWKSSESIGCAVAHCNLGAIGGNFKDMYTWYTVCNYYPVGNVEGYFLANVLAS